MGRARVAQRELHLVVVGGHSELASALALRHRLLELWLVSDGRLLHRPGARLSLRNRELERVDASRQRSNSKILTFTEKVMRLNSQTEFGS